MMGQLLRTGILGAGRMAQGFDHPGDARVLSLAHAVCRCPGLVLGGFYDVAAGRAAAAEKKWNCPASPRQREVWLDEGWDVVCIASPDTAHEADLEAVLERRPKAVLVEKPLALDGASGLRLLRRARSLGIPVLVNFPRRWHSGVRAVAKLLTDGELGEVKTVQATCSGGVLHNGIHALDLVSMWCGPLKVEGRKKHGWGQWEWLLRSRTGPMRLMLTEAVQTCYVFEVRVEATEGRVELGGCPEKLVLMRPGAHPVFKEFSCLLPKRVWNIEGEDLLTRVLSQVVCCARSHQEAKRQMELEIQQQTFFHQALPLSFLNAS